MSGGSHDYKYSVLDEYYIGKMFDCELDEMLRNLGKVLYELEWWQSGDTSEEDYRKEVQKFKNKWFGRRDKNLRELLLEKLDKIKVEINKL